MRKLWVITGHIFFWVTFPALFVYLLFSKRTRVLIWADDELLVVKGWQSANNRWMLPGGGLHRGEDSLAGALREVYEETGISLDATDVTLLKADVRAHSLAHFTYDVYVVQLRGKPPIRLQRGELIAYNWLSLTNMVDQSGLLSPETAQCLEIWKSQR